MGYGVLTRSEHTIGHHMNDERYTITLVWDADELPRYSGEWAMIVVDNTTGEVETSWCGWQSGPFAPIYSRKRRADKPNALEDALTLTAHTCDLMDSGDFTFYPDND